MASVQGDKNRAGFGHSRVAMRRDTQEGASGCNEMRNDDKSTPQNWKRNQLQIEDLCEPMQVDTMENEIGPSRIRTCNQGIMSPPPNSLTTEEIVCCDDASFHPTSRADSQNEVEPELARLIDAWPTLPEPLRAGILAMVDAAAK
jgi:hypothetical protein